MSIIDMGLFLIAVFITVLTVQLVKHFKNKKIKQRLVEIKDSLNNHVAKFGGLASIVTFEVLIGDMAKLHSDITFVLINRPDFAEVQLCRAGIVDSYYYIPPFADNLSYQSEPQGVNTKRNLYPKYLNQAHESITGAIWSVMSISGKDMTREDIDDMVYLFRNDNSKVEAYVFRASRTHVIVRVTSRENHELSIEQMVPCKH